MTSNLKRFLSVDNISQSGVTWGGGSLSSGLCPHTKGGLSPSPWLTHFHRLLFTATKEQGVSLMGAWLRHRHHHVASAGFSGERGAQFCSWPSPPPLPLLARQNHRFHLVAGLGGLGSVTQRGCNVSPRRVSGHAILSRNLVNSIYI